VQARHNQELYDNSALRIHRYTVHRFHILKVCITLLVLFLSACSPDTADTSQTLGLHATNTSALVRGKRHIVSAAHPLAAEAGRDILRAGGNAIDAAIATELVLSLVEPQSSGIGGGSFLLYFDAASQRLFAYDGRETAPKSTRSDMFLTPSGQPMTFYDAAVGGLAVGVPGLLRMLELAHRDHGRLSWHRLFQPAIQAAKDGFAVTPRLHRMIARDPFLSASPSTAGYFHDANGAALAVGTRRTNAAFAETLERIARDGADAFYSGDIAKDIVATVQTAYRHPGGLSLTDLAAYQAKRREPLCRPYRRWTVCGMPPPTSGGIATLQILGILERFNLAALSPSSALAVHRFTEASKIAFSDRNAYVADPDMIEVPTEALLDRRYLSRRSRLIHDHARPHVSPGGPLDGIGAVYPALSEPDYGHSTTHLSVADGEGNVVSMTTSIENAFGSRLMVRGFLLNNQLSDFSFTPERADRQIANRPAAGKRPRSSMAPTVVLDARGDPVVAIGSPGGSRIINYVALTLIAVLDWGLDIQSAIDLPRVVNVNGTIELERGTHLAALEPTLESIGHEVVVRPLSSGLHGIALVDGVWTGGADPRREGVVLAD